MRALRKLSLNLKYFIKDQSVRRHRPQAYYFIDDLEHFPNKTNLFLEYSKIVVEVIKFKTFLMDELLHESGIQFNTWQRFTTNRFILMSNFKVLEVLDIKLNKEAVFDSLVSSLEPFPVNKSVLEGSTERLNSVVSIRNEIELQYLSWKFQINYFELAATMKRLKPLFFFGRSLSSLQRHCTFLPFSCKNSKIPLMDKLYILSTIPFKLNSLPSFPPRIGSLRVNAAVHTCPRFLSKPYPVRELLIKILLSCGFSLKQIDEGLPFLNIHLKRFLYFLDYLLSSSLAESRNEINFLKVFFFSLPTLKSLVEGSGKTFSDLIVILRMKCKKDLGHANISQINSIINKYLEVDDEKVLKLKHHPQYQKCTIFSIEETIEYLLYRKFTEKEIAESLAIVLYPWYEVKGTLLKVVKNSKHLEGYGFLNGTVARETNLFSGGTTTKRKTLQLCLFYLIKEIDIPRVSP